MQNDELIPLLRIHDICRGLSNEEIEFIAKQGELINIQAGESLYQGGTELEYLYFILLGRLRIFVYSLTGKRSTLRYASAGDQFGFLIMVTEEDSNIDVEVDERSLLFRIERSKAMALGDQFPVLRRNLFRKIGLAVRDSLTTHRKRSTSRIVAFIRSNNQSRLVAMEVIRKLSSIGETVGVMSDALDRFDDPSVSHFPLVNEAGEYIDEHQVREFVSQWDNINRIMIVVDRSYPREKLTRLISMCDTVFYVSTVSEKDDSISELKEILTAAPSWKKKLHLVWALEENQNVVPFVPELPKLVERDFKIQVANPLGISRLFVQGRDRLVHYLRGVSVGLALSGGAAHGMSHLGVLKALEESGITIDAIAGTSAGVLTGVIYCSGYSPDWGIEHFSRDLTPGSIYKHLPMGDGLYMLKQYRSHHWEVMLRKYVFDWKLEQLPIPIHTVTTDLISAKSIVRSEGDAVNALLESINLPVIAAPICRDGMLLVDGGVLNNLPADELLKLGSNMIIGVDVSAHIEQCVGENTPNTPTEQMKSPNAVITLLRCLSVQAHSMSSKGAEPADVTITPDVSKFEPTAFTKTPEMAEVGYQATMDIMPRIREVLQGLDRELFAD